MDEIFKIPKLLRQSKTDDVIEIMQKYNIDTATLIQLLACGYERKTGLNRCFRCKHAVKKWKGYVYCTLKREKKNQLSTCQQFITKF